jgi:hypothetical protein
MMLSDDMPCWNDAPVWADFVAQDAGGQWHWFELKPITVNELTEWVPTIHSQFEAATESSVSNWKEMIFSRPSKLETDHES